ncbi:hypothetical protein SULI_02750 [Saccharolobus solfataricus]|nr:hypothetical protein [Saccharolobus solfataricus]AKA72935.1 hypothetical protein SULB_0538 [Saccharolobus solfataricus]AKA75634.1 hypothetical protein SULC_0536 [Saccharolobus solfataricus]AKA78327.1 hypothetical protein SULA_0536 [Saccharolobus solfataricus]AZF67446.1 hypothetical protein SULG_02750 [Saccharolobus solfataricus]AZF70066.1 hypothetical protein SULH_02750 [Saccharolobus solfataricus]
MGVSISDIKYIVERPEIFGFKVETIRKDNGFNTVINDVKQNGIRIDNYWVTCNKDNGECEVVDDNSNSLIIVNFIKKTIIKYVTSKL